MKKKDILDILQVLDNKLRENHRELEMKIFGGASMCLQFQNRGADDIDAIYIKDANVLKIINDISNELNLKEDWLDSSGTEYQSENATWIEISCVSHFNNLKVTVASPEYMLALKCLASRYKTKDDVQDIKFLMEYLNINSINEVDNIIGNYYKNIESLYQIIVEAIIDGTEQYF